MFSASRQAITVSSTLILSAMFLQARAQDSIKVEAGYSISVFAKGVAGKYTKPGS